MTNLFSELFPTERNEIGDHNLVAESRMTAPSGTNRALCDCFSWVSCLQVGFAIDWNGPTVTKPSPISLLDDYASAGIFANQLFRDDIGIFRLGGNRPWDGRSRIGGGGMQSCDNHATEGLACRQSGEAHQGFY